MFIIIELKTEVFPMDKSKTSQSQPSKVVSKPNLSSWKDLISEQDYEELKNTLDLLDEDDWFFVCFALLENKKEE